MFVLVLVTQFYRALCNVLKPVPDWLIQHIRMSICLRFELGNPISKNKNVLCYDLHESTVGQGNCCTIDLSLDQANLHFSFEKLQNELHGDLKLYSEVKIWGQSDLATFIAKLFFSGARGYEKVVLESDWKTVISILSKPPTPSDPNRGSTENWNLVENSLVRIGHEKFLAFIEKKPFCWLVGWKLW